MNAWAMHPDPGAEGGAVCERRGVLGSVVGAQALSAHRDEPLV